MGCKIQWKFYTIVYLSTLLTSVLCLLKNEFEYEMSDFLPYFIFGYSFGAVDNNMKVKITENSK